MRENSLKSWYEEGSGVPPFKFSNSGLQGPTYQPLNTTYDPPKTALMVR